LVHMPVLRSVCPASRITRRYAVSAEKNDCVNTNLSALTTHLLSTLLLQDALDCRNLVRRAAHENSEARVAEAHVVTNGSGQPRKSAQDEHARNRGQSANQNHHFETDDRVGNPRRDCLAAHNKRPVIRRPDCHPVSERGAEQAPDKGEQPHLAHRWMNRMLQLVTRRGRIHIEVIEAVPLQLLDGMRGGIQLIEGRKYAYHLSALP